MDGFMDEFMQAMADVFPQLLVQFEDFSTDNAFKYTSFPSHPWRR
jgi:malate dehydrogenase (oxaloacetate-decarboxylating)(NADP+)